MLRELLPPEPDSLPPVAPPRAKGGAPLGNQSHVTHGLTCGVWPPGTDHDRRLAQDFTRALREAVVDAGGELDVVTCAIIQTCTRWERHARLAAKWLRDEGHAMTPDQKLAFSRDVARASSERDRAIRSLRLDQRRDPNPWDSIDEVSHAITRPTQEEISQGNEAGMGDTTSTRQNSLAQGSAGGETHGVEE